MTPRDRVIRRLQRLSAGREYSETRTVVGGYRNDDSSIAADVTAGLDEAGMIWVHPQSEGDNFAVLNLNVSDDCAGVLLKIGRAVDSGEWEVIRVAGRNKTTIGAVRARAANTPDKPAREPNILVPDDNLLGGRVRLFAEGTLKVCAESFPYVDSNGDEAWWDGDVDDSSHVLDLSASVPATADHHRIVRIALNPDATTPALVAVDDAGSVVQSTPRSPANVKDTVLASGYYSLGAALLRTDDTTIPKGNLWTHRYYVNNPAVNGDMTKAEYDADDDGVVDEALHAATADSADSVAWTDITGVPAAFPPDAHTHDADDITYTPAADTDWNSDADPGDVADALDQLAARVSTAEDDLDTHTHTLADVTDAGTMAAQDADSVAITGGTANNLSELSATKDTTTLEVALSNFGATISAFLNFKRGRNTAASPQMVQADDQLAAIGAMGYDSALAAFPSIPPVRIALFAAEDYDGDGRGSYGQLESTQIGATSRGAALTWHDDKTIEFYGKLRTPTTLTIPAGRLTLTSGTPVTTSSVTGATTLYYTPYIGNAIPLYNGSKWDVHLFTELSASLTGLTASLPYDVFIYNNAGTLTLELTAWTNATTRATALVYQDGVYVKSGATARRYLGTICINSTGGQCDDSLTFRGVWNYANRVPRVMRADGTSAADHTYNNTTVRSWNNDATLRLSLVTGVAEAALQLNVYGRISVASNTLAYISVGEDSTSSELDDFDVGYNVTGDFRAGAAKAIAAKLGFHYYQLLERGNANAPSFRYAYLSGIHMC